MAEKQQSAKSSPTQTLDLRPVSKTAKVDTDKRRRFSLPNFSTKRLMPWAVVVLVVVIVVVGIKFALSNGSDHPFASQLVSSADFPLYYPSKLPAGYTFNKSAASYSNGVLIFTITASGGRTVDVSEEATPSGYDFSQIQSRNTFRTSVGQVAINYNQSSTSASIAGAQTWTLVRATTAVTTSDITTLLSNFAPVAK